MPVTHSLLEKTTSFSASIPTAAANVPSGVSIAVAISASQGNAVSSVTDNAGNTYQQKAQIAGGDERLYWFVAENIVGNSALVTTVVLGGGDATVVHRIRVDGGIYDDNALAEGSTNNLGSYRQSFASGSPLEAGSLLLLLNNTAGYGPSSPGTAVDSPGVLVSQETDWNTWWVSFVAAATATGTSAVTFAWAQSPTTGPSSLSSTAIIIGFKPAATAPVAQVSGRFYDDDDSESAMTALAAQDAGITRAADVNTVVRFLLQAEGDPASFTPQIEYQRDDEGSTWHQLLPLLTGSNPTVAASGSVAAGTNSATPSYASGTTARSALFLAVTGRSNTASTAFAVTGWTSLVELEGGTGTWAADTGTRRAAVFRKDSVSGTESGTVTVGYTSGTSTSSTLAGSHFRVEVPAGYTLDVATTSGADTTNGTGYSATGSSISLQPGDLLIAVTAQNLDTGTVSSGDALSASGITFGSFSRFQDSARTEGNDHRHIVASAVVTAGTATVAPTRSFTASGNCSGPTVFIRLRLIPESQAFVLAASSNIAASGATATTQRLTGGTGTFAAGWLTDDVNPGPAIDLDEDENTEVGACVQANSAVVVDDETYRFRVTKAGAPLDGYSYIEWTIGSGSSGEPVTLVVGNAVHGHTASGPTLTQANTLSVGHSVHAQLAAAVELTVAITLSVGNAAHAHVADDLELTQAQLLAIAASAHSQVASAPAMTQAHALGIYGSFHGHVAEVVELSQAQVLGVLSAVHTHAAQQLALSQARTLDVADSVHQQAAGGVSLSQTHVLDVEGAVHAHLGEELEIIQGATLQGLSTVHQQAAAQLELTQASILTIGESVHSLASAQVALSQGVVLAVASALHEHAAADPELSQSALLAIASCAHLHTAGAVDLTQAATLIVSDSVHAQLVRAIGLRMPGGPAVPPGRTIVVKAGGRTVIVQAASRTITVPAGARTITVH